MIAIYARQSVDKKDSISIETQIEDCEYEAKGESYVVYSDKGYSGKNTDRPKFKEMMTDIKNGKITKVICYKLDRISRSLLDFAEIMKVFKEHDVKFVSMNEKFDTSTAMGRAMLNICMVFAELERETIQLRVTDTYNSRSKAGFYMGGRVPYGFKKVPYMLNGKSTSQYEPVPDEIDQIKTLFELYSKPVTSLADIVRYFKSNGIQKTRGKEWSTSRLTEILRNPIYVRADVDIYNFYKARQTDIVNDISEFVGTNGSYLYTKNESKTEGQNKDKNKDRPKEKTKGKNMSHYSNMTLVLAPHEGIIDSDTFIRCRLKAEQNIQIPNGRHSHTTWISGKLKCIKCEYAMKYNKWSGKTVDNEYYLCSAVHEGKCEGVGAVKKDYIEQVVFEQMQTKIKSLRIEQNQSNPNQAEINAKKSLIATKENEIDKILENFKLASPEIIARMNKEVDELANEIKGLNSQIYKLETIKTNQRKLDTTALDKIFKNWNNVAKEDRQKVVDILITKVLVSKDKIEIIWKI